jgi:hypothetical protein
MPASLDPQLAMDERAINNPELEKALERRLRAKDDVAEVRGVYKKAHAEVQAAIELLPDFEPDSALRVGRFRITKRHIDARSVSFETEARDQISIGLVDEDGQPLKRTAAAERRSATDDVDEDLRPTGEVNTDALRVEAERSIVKDDAPTPIRKPRANGSTDQPRLS